VQSGPDEHCQTLLFAGQIAASESIFRMQMRTIEPKLGWSCALAIILGASALQVGLYAQQPTKLSPKVMAIVNVPLAELKDDDPPLLRLKKERFNAALREAKARIDLYGRGLTRLAELIEVGERLFGAEIDLYDKPGQKAQVLESQLDVYIEAEANLEKRVKEGLATQADLERLRYNKYSVEIDLFNAKNMHDDQESKAQPTPQ
jgi:hypothetical protein